VSLHSFPFSPSSTCSSYATATTLFFSTFIVLLVMARRALPGDAAKVSKNLRKDKQHKKTYRYSELNTYDFHGPVMATVMPGPWILTKLVLPDTENTPPANSDSYPTFSASL